MEENQVELVSDKKDAEKSYFDGSAFGRLGWIILGTLLTGLTLGLCFPFAKCWLYTWEAKHTVIDGRRLKFCGKPSGFFGTWLLCILLTIVTLGIYGFYVPIKFQKWKEANTFFEDELTSYDSELKLQYEKVSAFDGTFWQYFGWHLLGLLLTVFTFGICYPVSVNMIYSWEQRHKIYCKKRCSFDGSAGGLFGTWILYIFLTIITLGIFSIWVPVKIQNWITKHTHLEDESKAAVKKETSDVKGILSIVIVAWAFICFLASMLLKTPVVQYLDFLRYIAFFDWVSISGLVITVVVFLMLTLSKRNSTKKISILLSVLTACSYRIVDMYYLRMNYLSYYKQLPYGFLFIISFILYLITIILTIVSCSVILFAKKEKVKKNSFMIFGISSVLLSFLPLLSPNLYVFENIPYLLLKLFPVLLMFITLFLYLFEIEKDDVVKEELLSLKKKVLPRISLILGIIACPTTLIFITLGAPLLIISNIGISFGIIAILLAVISKKQAEKKGMAVAGLILGIVSIVSPFVLALICIIVEQF